jgi:hypothetical protein
MFWSCKLDNPPRVLYYEGAAIVKDLKAGQPALEVLYDILLFAPGLSGENPEINDLFWVNLFIEEDKQTNKDTMFVSNISYKQVGYSVAEPETAIASDFTYTIDRALMWRNHAGNIWIFEFEQMAPDGQILDYEMRFDKESGETHPTVYLRSKKTNTVDGSNKKTITKFGFDLTPLIEEYANVTSHTLTFWVKYLSDFNADDGEIFTSFITNPVTVKVHGTSDGLSTSAKQWQ